MSLAPRVRIIWGSGRVIPGRWYLGLFGFCERAPGYPGDGLAVSVRGLLAWGSGMALAVYLAGAGVLFHVWQRNPHNALTYEDAVMYPVRRAQISTEIGRAFNAQGLDAWNANKHQEAATLLRQGLARDPHDLKARLALAQFYTMQNRRALAIDTLQEGLTDAYPGRSYMKALFDLAEQLEDFDRVIELSARYRPRLSPAADEAEQRWLGGRQFAALLSTERTAEAAAFAEREGDGLVAQEQRALALLELKKTEEAIRFLATMREKPGADLATIARLEVRAFREAKRFAEMDRALAEVRRGAPAAPAPLVYAVVQLAMADRDEAARVALEDYVFRFGATLANLQLVAEPLAEIGHAALLERCAAVAVERGHARLPFDLMLAQTHIQTGQWTAASRILRDLAVPAGPQARAGVAWQEWMRRLADAAATNAEARQLALTEFLRGRPWPVVVYRRSIAALRLAGRDETARDVAVLGSAAFPASAWLKRQAAELSRELDAQPPGTVAVGSTRGPQVSLSEADFFARLEAQLAAASWDSALDAILALRNTRPPPPWLTRREPELRLVQVRLGHKLDRTRDMLTAARIYLNGSNDRSAKLLEVAREIYREDTTRAIALAEEVGRRSPDYSSAQLLLAEWQPRK